MVAHQAGKAKEKAVSGFRRTNAASRDVKPTGSTIGAPLRHCERLSCWVTSVQDFPSDQSLV
jgi:hypothetical protein